MIIGVLKEIKKDEYRVAMVPNGAELLVKDGNEVLIQNDAGKGSGYENDAYLAAGAEIVETAKEICARADMIVKVKEPQPEEIAMFRPEQIIFCFFHFAGSYELTEACLDKKIAAVAYETLSDQNGLLPLLMPMSEVAGKMSIQEGAKCLEAPMHGEGILIGGATGADPANVLILGGGIVGTNAAEVASELGATVVVMDINKSRLLELNDILPPNASAVYCDKEAINQLTTEADLVVGAVLVPGGKAPTLITQETLKGMKEGSVIVDVAIDQGGCCETSRPTTHSDPVFIVEGVVHYCVANMPGAVGRTSTQALCSATLPYCRELANIGLDEFIKLSPGHEAALNMRNGKILCKAVSDTFPDL